MKEMCLFGVGLKTLCTPYEQLPYPQGYAYPSLRTADLQNYSARPIMMGGLKSAGKVSRII